MNGSTVKRTAFPLLMWVVAMLAGCQGDPSQPTATEVSVVEPTAAVAPTAEPTAPVVPAAEPTVEPTAGPETSDLVAVPFDLGEATLVQAEYVSEAVRQMPVRLEGMIAVPPTGDNLPIAVIIHGSHGSGCSSPDGVTERWPCPDEESRHFEGLAYLLEALAQRGYFSLAINANPIYVMAYGEENTPMRAPILFDLYMEKLAAATNGEDVGFGVDLAGRVDWSRLVALGHSKGGAAVNWIMGSRAGRTDPEQVSAGQGPIAVAVLLAPFGHGDPEGGLSAPTAIILPACDRDLAGLDGQTYYERQRIKAETENPVISVLLQWANHNRFNADLEDEWLARGTVACTPESLLAAGPQQAFLAEYVPRFLDLALGIAGDEAQLLGLDATQPAPAKLFGREVLTSLLLPAGQRLRLPLDSGAAAGPATAVYCPEGFAGAGSRDEACRRIQLNQPASPEEWVVSWNGRDGAYTVTLPEESQDLSGYETLHLRAFVDPLSELNPEGQSQAFSLRLADGSGATAVMPVAHEPALAFPYGATITFEDQPGQVLWDNNVLLSSIRVPLAGFGGVDLSDIQSIELVFDRTDSGTLFITDLELLQGAGGE